MRFNEKLVFKDKLKRNNSPLAITVKENLHKNWLENFENKGDDELVTATAQGTESKTRKILTSEKNEKVTRRERKRKSRPTLTGNVKKVRKIPKRLETKGKSKTPTKLHQKR